MNVASSDSNWLNTHKPETRTEGKTEADTEIHTYVKLLIIIYQIYIGKWIEKSGDILMQRYKDISLRTKSLVMNNFWPSYRSEISPFILSISITG